MRGDVCGADHRPAAHATTWHGENTATDAPPRSASRRTEPRDVVVVGAGVIGIATALTLLDRGHGVTVIDAAAGAGLETSFANGAQLSYAYTDALASPATLAALPRLMLGLDPAFRLRASFDVDFLRWGLSFLRNATPERFRSNTIEGMALAFQSKIALKRLASRFGIDFLHSAPGKLHLLRSARSMARAREAAALKVRFGARQRIVDAEEALAIEPALADARSQIVGAVHTRDEEAGDPHRFCTQGATAIAASGRGELLFGHSVDRIDREGDRTRVHTRTGRAIDADHVVLCAGHQSGVLAKRIGARLPCLLSFD